LIWCDRVVIPPPGRESVVTELHAGHFGVSRIKALACGLVWWPKFDVDIEDVANQCLIVYQINHYHLLLHYNHGVGLPGQP